MEYNQPYPERVSGLQKARPDRHYKFGQGYSDMIATATHIGFFAKNRLPVDIAKLQKSKIVVLPHAPKRCSKCGDYMRLKKGSSCRYTCVGKCLDTKAIRFIKKQKMKQFANKPIESRHIEGVVLTTDLIHA